MHRIAISIAFTDANYTNFLSVVIEHNLDVIKTADWIIDMSLEGGSGGGEVVGVGAPEDIAANPASHTGKYLKRLLV